MRWRRRKPKHGPQYVAPLNDDSGWSLDGMTAGTTRIDVAPKQVRFVPCAECQERFKRQLREAAS